MEGGIKGRVGDKKGDIHNMQERGRFSVVPTDVEK